MSLSSLAWLIPLPPFLAFVAIILVTRHRKALSHTLAIGMMGVSFVLAQIVFWNGVLSGRLAEEPITASVAWLPFREVGSWLRVGVLVDPLTAVMLFMVPLVCLLIFIYSAEYMRGDPHYSRFFAYLSLFATGMLGLIVADNLLALFVFWEIMGLCSYLLIGFWFEKPSAYRAAMKAFMTTRVGDVLMLLGIVYLYSQTGRLDFETLLSPATLTTLGATPAVIGGLSVAGLAGLLIFAGTVGKSAQFPLHVWLPDAMEGPTPVSAMIHAATMVSAGVYLIIRTFPLLAAGETPLPAMALIGGFSAFFAATIAIAQNDIKRVMAYSTISQLAYMVAALGVGAYVAAIFHLLMHAFFKALLFLSSGSVIHGVEHGAHHSHQHLDAQDMFNMGGLRRRMPRTFIAFMAGGLALTGIPPFAGFWSKDAILGGAFEAFVESGTISWGLYVWLLLSASALLTALYVGRQMFLTFGGEPRTPAAEHAAETGWAIGLPLLVLAAFAVLAGFAGVPEEFPLLGPLLGNNWLLGFVGEQYGEASLNFGVMGLSVALALAGWGLAWLLYGRKPLMAGQPDPLVAALGPIHTLLRNKYYVDELYTAVVVRPVVAIAAWVYTAVDRAIVDGALHGIGRAAQRLAEATRVFDRTVINGGVDSMTEGMKQFARVFRAVQTERLQDYLLIALASVVAFGLVLYIFTR
ncbi:MAG TPA: NADH-quinone oxidoreductase subunit L [Anaerolineae bacterium]|nr:NADH-quinone oxidoreductase subunit L [Anaerolineae bacterium]